MTTKQLRTELNKKIDNTKMKIIGLDIDLLRAGMDANYTEAKNVIKRKDFLENRSDTLIEILYMLGE